MPGLLLRMDNAAAPAAKDRGLAEKVPPKKTGFFARYSSLPHQFQLLTLKEGHLHIFSVSRDVRRDIEEVLSPGEAQASSGNNFVKA